MPLIVPNKYAVEVAAVVVILTCCLPLTAYEDDEDDIVRLACIRTTRAFLRDHDCSHIS